MKPQGKSGESSLSVADLVSMSLDDVHALGKDKRGPKPIDPARVEFRQKQVRKGKETPAYKNYLSCIAKKNRRKFDENHPTTPNPREDISNKRWKGKYAKWRRQLHIWNPTEEFKSPGSKTKEEEEKKAD